MLVEQMFVFTISNGNISVAILNCFFVFCFLFFFTFAAGVIDQDYRGNVGVVLFNFADTEFESEYTSILFIAELIHYPLTGTRWQILIC